MKKMSFSPSIRSTFALLIGATFLTPAQLLASSASVSEDEVVSSVAKKVSADSELCSLTNIASQLTTHADRAEHRISKLKKLVEASADDIAEDRDSIDLRAIVKTVMPRGTEESLEGIHDAHERIAAAYELTTPLVAFTAKVKQLEQEVEEKHQTMLRLKEQAGKSGEIESTLQEKHAKALKQKEDEATAKIAEKQRELDEVKADHQKVLEAVTQERDEAKEAIIAKQSELEKVMQQNEEVKKQKETAYKKAGSLNIGIKELTDAFKGKDLTTIDENAARDLLKAIQDKLTELVK